MNVAGNMSFALRLAGTPKSEIHRRVQHAASMLELTDYLDRKLSKVDGKVGYALDPEGSRCGSETGGFAVGIPANSKNQETAFLFIQYITSRAGDKRMVELGGDPIRLSTYEHYQDQYDEYSVILEQLPCADPDWRPLIPEWNEPNIDVLGQALTQVMTTDDPIQPIMDAAAEKARAIMEREGHYKWAEYRQQIWSANMVSKYGQ